MTGARPGVDYKQAFDSLTVEVTMNDLYDIGVTDNKLNLMHACDNEARVSIKTPVGLTERVPVIKTVAQGDVNSTTKCTVSVNDISEEHEKNLEDNLYKYKNSVPVPPLGMVDIGIANVAYCGLDSALATAHLNSQTGLKNLQFGTEKCVKLHVGYKSIVCPDNYIDNWTLEKNKETVSSVWDLQDKESGLHSIKEVTEWKYLGDILTSNAKCDANVRERVKRGTGASLQVTQMLGDLCLGKFYFEAANILRSSLFLSSLISNSESWVNLNSKNLSDLEAGSRYTIIKKLFCSTNENS